MSETTHAWPRETVSGSNDPEHLREAGSRGIPWEVLQDSLNVMAVLSVVGGYIGGVMMLFVHQQSPRGDIYMVPGALLAGGGLTLASKAPYRLRAMILLLALFAACVLTNQVTGEPQMQLLYAFFVLVAGILLGPKAATLAAALGASVMVCQGRSTGQNDLSIVSPSLICLSVVVVWATIGRLHRFIHRLELAEIHAWEAAREARARQSELHRVVRALEEATYRVERMNNELYLANRETEQARAFKARFTATVSHELRGPLNLLLGFSRMIVLHPERYEEPLPACYRADIDTIYRNSQHLLALVDDVLDLSQIEAERLPLVKDRIRLHEDVIGKVVAMVQPLVERKGLYLRQNIPDDLPPIVADPVRLRQVMLNLLANAVRLTERGGITVAGKQQDGHLLVSVQDTGPGIPKDQIPRLFKEFEQVCSTSSQENKGSGLGLSISKHLVELHGGRIWVESEPGVGTTVTFSLPLASHESARTQLIRTGDKRHREDVKSYLIIHQDPLITRALGRHVEGYRPIGLTEVREAPELIEELHPRAIVTTPPLAENLKQQLGEMSFDVPIITCELPNTAEHANYGGLMGYLVKPISAETVVAFARRVEGEGETTIMLVDDEPDAVRLLESMLTSLPRRYRILKAYDGYQALELMQKSMPDLVFLDLIMPGLDGERTLSRMQADERLSGVPVVIISARDSMENPPTLGKRITLESQEPIQLAKAAKCIQAMLDWLSPNYLGKPESHAPCEREFLLEPASVAPPLRPW